MHKPDRVIALSLVIVALAGYVSVANLLYGLSLAFLPLGGISVELPLILLLLGLVSLNIARHRKRAQTYPNPQK